MDEINMTDHEARVDIVKNEKNLDKKTEKSVKKGDNQKLENCTRKENTPMRPEFASFIYGKYLTRYEKDEILRYTDVYYTGNNGSKTVPNYELDNFGFDDGQKYILHKSDHLAYRYEIARIVGRGCFSQVISAKDHKTNMNVAIKIWLNEPKFKRLCKNEMSILTKLSKDDPENIFSIVYPLEKFVFRSHDCIVFPLLGPNLYYILHKVHPNGLHPKIVKRYTRSLVSCLLALRKHNVIHCDLKPENIVVTPDGRDIKVTDFGSSTEVGGFLCPYIQTRHYRAPEVLFQSSYNCQVDMWSLGCIVYELFTASPLLRGDDEADQVSVILGCLGMPSMHLVPKYKEWRKFVDSNNIPRYCIYDQTTKTIQGSRNCKGIYRGPPGYFPLEDLLVNPPPHMLSFIKSCLIFDPSTRLNPVTALLHPFILNSKTKSFYNQLNYIIYPAGGTMHSTLLDAKSLTKPNFEAKVNQKSVISCETSLEFVKTDDGICTSGVIDEVASDLNSCSLSTKTDSASDDQLSSTDPIMTFQTSSKQEEVVDSVNCGVDQK